MLAFAIMAAIRHHANQPIPKKTMRHPARNHPVLSDGQSRKSGGLQTDSHKNVSDPPSL
jgi:hypothetical protein